MKIRALTKEELLTVYINLFTEIFGEWNDQQNPSFVLVIDNKDNESIGFVACYLMNKTTVYMPFVGLKEEYQKKGHPRILFKIEDFLRERGITLITGKVHQFDTRTLLVSLRTGWMVYGIERGTEVDGLWILISKYIGGKDDGV